MKRYYRAWGLYKVFFDRWLLLTSQSWNHHFAKFTDMFRVSYSHLHHPLLFYDLRPYVVTRVTRRVPLVEHELLILSEYLMSPPMFCCTRVVECLVFCVVFCGSLLVFLSVFVLPLCCLPFCGLRASGYPFGIHKLFLCLISIHFSLENRMHKLYNSESP